MFLFHHAHNVRQSQKSHSTLLQPEAEIMFSGCEKTESPEHSIQAKYISVAETMLFFYLIMTVNSDIVALL